MFIGREKEKNLELFTRQALEVLEPDLREADFAAIESLFDFISRHRCCCPLGYRQNRKTN